MSLQEHTQAFAKRAMLSVKAKSKQSSQTSSLARGGQVHTSASLCCLVNIPEKVYLVFEHTKAPGTGILTGEDCVCHVSADRDTPFCKPDHLSAVLLAIWA